MDKITVPAKILADNLQKLDDGVLHKSLGDLITTINYIGGDITLPVFQLNTYFLSLTYGDGNVLTVVETSEGYLLGMVDTTLNAVVPLTHKGVGKLSPRVIIIPDDDDINELSRCAMTGTQIRLSTKPTLVKH